MGTAFALSMGLSMKPIHSILLPVDFSGASSEALTLAVEMARAFDAEIILLHVWEMPAYPYQELLANSVELLTASEAAAKAQLSRTLEGLSKVWPRSRSLLKSGVAWQQVLEAIDEVSPQLVVMATHGRRGLAHALMGSVAEKVVQGSKVPVLTVRATPA
jgi:nucleotide-binding universal stress UspA family protein